MNAPIFGLTFFGWLLISHLCGDFLFQTNWHANNKARGKFINGALVTHCLIYTACFVPALLLHGVSLTALLLIFGSHILLDRRFIIIWWRTHINRCPADVIERTFFLTVIIDQIFHILILVAVAHWNYFGNVWF